MGEASFTFPQLAGALEAMAAELAAMRERLDQLSPRDGWYSVKSAAEFLDLSEDAVRAAERSGRLVAVRSASGRLLFSRDALNDYARGVVRAR